MMDAGALRLVSTQNNDGGWDWTSTPDTDSSLGIPSPANTIGVTALGMLRTYKHITNQAYLDSSIKSYELLLANSSTRIRGSDITFLVELSEITGNSIYADLAKTRWDADVVTYGTDATGFANFLVTNRSGAKWAAWDINLTVVGLDALNRYFPGQGYDSQAIEMAEVAHTTIAGITTADTSYTLAVAGAIETYVLTGLYSADITTLVADLLATQVADGSFESDIQSTAYAIISLDKVGANSQQIMAAANFLSSVQQVSGGYVDAWGEYTEVDSEATQAIEKLLN
jgi:hypothetical protein